MDLAITPGALRGTLTPPPSKSQAHRLILCAALAEGTSRIENLALSDDIRATLGCARALGAEFRLADGTLTVTGLGGRKSRGELPQFACGESGSTLRFLLPVALAVAGGGVFRGRGRLMQRPQKPYFDLFDEKGVFYQVSEDALTVRGELQGGRYCLPGNVSSQFFTGLLYALPLLDAPSVIVPTTALESADYIAMTRQALAAAGVMVSLRPDGSYAVAPQRYQAFSCRVEADWSQAAFWLAARGLGNELTLLGLDEASLQGDRRILPYAQRLAEAGDLRLDLSQCPDLAPPLAALAAVRAGTCILSGAARLRLKESDRLATVSRTLRAFGVETEESADALSIHGQSALRGGVEIDCCGDHRIAMMSAVCATRCTGGEVTLRGADCVSKSYPDFWEVYQSLGGMIHVV